MTGRDRGPRRGTVREKHPSWRRRTRSTAMSLSTRHLRRAHGRASNHSVERRLAEFKPVLSNRRRGKDNRRNLTADEGWRSQIPKVSSTPCAQCRYDDRPTEACGQVRNQAEDRAKQPPRTVEMGVLVGASRRLGKRSSRSGNASGAAEHRPSGSQTRSAHRSGGEHTTGPEAVDS